MKVQFSTPANSITCLLKILSAWEINYIKRNIPNNNEKLLSSIPLDISKWSNYLVTIELHLHFLPYLNILSLGLLFNINFCAITLSCIINIENNDNLQFNIDVGNLKLPCINNIFFLLCLNIRISEYILNLIICMHYALVDSGSQSNLCFSC